MENEMKLLMALCDALGFDVETTLDYQERETAINPTDYVISPGIEYCVDNTGAYSLTDKGGYIVKIISLFSCMSPYSDFSP